MTHARGIRGGRLALGTTIALVMVLEPAMTRSADAKMPVPTATMTVQPAATSFTSLSTTVPGAALR